jgi:hypothetical protein
MYITCMYLRVIWESPLGVHWSIATKNGLMNLVDILGSTIQIGQHTVRSANAHVTDITVTGKQENLRREVCFSTWKPRIPWAIAVVNNTVTTTHYSVPETEIDCLAIHRAGMARVCM